MKENIFKFIFGQKPYVYGLAYLALIPIFAAIFTFCPEATLNLNSHEKGFVSSLYFSVITITTLGYGDITPVGTLSQILTASESVLGIVLIGLFLNTLSHQQAEEVKENEKQAQLKRDKKQDINRLLAFSKLMNITIDNYLIYSLPIIQPRTKRKTYKHDPIDTFLDIKFTFNDLHDLFEPSYRLTHEIGLPAIVRYFEAIKLLQSSIEDMIKLGYLQTWEDFEKKAIHFVKICTEYAHSRYILG